MEVRELTEEEAAELRSLERETDHIQAKVILGERYLKSILVQVSNIERQYRTSVTNNKHSARYNLRQKLAIFMGLKFVYMKYINKNRARLSVLFKELQKFGRMPDAIDE